MGALTDSSYDKNTTDGAVFSSQIYRQLPINSSYVQEFGLRECALICNLDVRTCNGFVYDHPGNCYLTQIRANTNLFTLTGSFEWYTQTGMQKSIISIFLILNISFIGSKS